MIKQKFTVRSWVNHVKDVQSRPPLPEKLVRQSRDELLSHPSSLIGQSDDFVDGRLREMEFYFRDAWKSRTSNEYLFKCYWVELQQLHELRRIRIEKHKGEISRADKEKIDELAAFVEYIELSPRAAGRNPIFAMSLWGEIMKIAPMDRL